MSEINYEQEVRFVLQSWGRFYPRWPDYVEGYEPIAGLNWRMALDLLTMDLLRRAREAFREKGGALRIQMDDGEWCDLGMVAGQDHYFIDECEHLHRALMAAIDEVDD